MGGNTRKAFIKDLFDSIPQPNFRSSKSASGFFIDLELN